MSTSLHAAIVGAGPYGLSLAAHLGGAGVNFRIFGKPMSTWIEHMPAGMFLKSDGFASNLSDPAGTYTLRRFCEATGEPYDDRLIPVRLDTFSAYGLSFQRNAVPSLEQKWVSEIRPAPEGFVLSLGDGEQVSARNVVLAVGITHFDFVPPELAQLPPDLVSHSALYGDIERLRGRTVTIVGAGASACDLAATLDAEGIEVTIVSRSPVLYFGHPPSTARRSRYQRLRHPSSGIGASLRSRIYADAPWLVHSLPQRLRSRIVKRHLGPSASWTVKDRILSRVPLLLSSSIGKAEPLNGQVRLTIRGEDGGEKALVTGHVIAATGYTVDLRRLGFLSEGLRARVRTVDGSPALNRQFESSVPGLYFVGLAAAASFGPVMRFAFGADYAARCVCRRFAGSAAASMATRPQVAGQE